MYIAALFLEVMVTVWNFAGYMRISDARIPVNWKFTECLFLSQAQWKILPE
jgi:hypothetical protein